MQEAHDSLPRLDWCLRERHFVGSREHVAEELDLLILTLVACRQTLSAGMSPLPTPAKPRGAWQRLVRLIGLSVVVVVAPGAARAQVGDPPVSPPPVVFGATLEGYYQWNANDPADRVVALRAYDTRSNTFAIQQLAGVVELPPAPASGRRHGLRVDLQFGQATTAVQGSAANESGRPTGRTSRPSAAACGSTSASSPRTSATRRTTPATTTPSRVRTCSTSCPSTTWACGPRLPSTTRSRSWRR
jgi:hypothetical protein